MVAGGTGPTWVSLGHGFWGSGDGVLLPGVEAWRSNQGRVRESGRVLLYTDAAVGSTRMYTYLKCLYMVHLFMLLCSQEKCFMDKNKVLKLRYKLNIIFLSVNLYFSGCQFYTWSTIHILCSHIDGGNENPVASKVVDIKTYQKSILIQRTVRITSGAPSLDTPLQPVIVRSQMGRVDVFAD